MTNFYITSHKGRARRRHAKADWGAESDSRKQEEARSSSSAFNLPKDKMSHFTFQIELFSTDASPCLPTNPYREFRAWRAFNDQEILKDTGNKSIEGCLNSK